MTCSEVRVWFPAHVRGLLGLTEQALADVHLRQCPECRRELERFRELVKPRGPIAQSHVFLRGVGHAAMGAGRRIGPRLTPLGASFARSSQELYRAGAKRIGPLRPRLRKTWASSLRWTVRLAGGAMRKAHTVGRLVVTRGRARSWRPDTVGRWSSRRRGLMSALLGAGTGLVGLALVAALVSLQSAEYGQHTTTLSSNRSAPPTGFPEKSPLTQAARAQPDQAADIHPPVAPKAAIQPPAVPKANSQPRAASKTAEIPAPVWIPAPTPLPGQQTGPPPLDGTRSADEAEATEASDRDRPDPARGGRGRSGAR